MPDYLHRSNKTAKAYGLLWNKIDPGNIPKKWHFNDLQDLVKDPIARGSIGIDVGSGCGYDTYIISAINPAIRMVSLEMSDGIYMAKTVAASLKNASFIKGSILDMPLKNCIFDFAYSFGALHHTPDPEKGISEINRIIKSGAPAFLYLYEDHSDNFIKFASIKAIAVLRKITTKIPPGCLYEICRFFSPFIVIFFTYPSKIMMRFKATKNLADKVPFNFGTHLFSVSGDLFDRFSAPIERRFSRKEALDLLIRNGFVNNRIGKIKSKAGWVVWGYKKND